MKVDQTYLPGKEYLYEKYAWILLAGPVVFLTLLSLVPLIGGY